MSDHYLQIGVLIGIFITIILQVWVQPKWFREDNKRQADLLVARFDAQLTALTILNNNATKTLDEASKFFKDAADRFNEIDKKLALMDEKWDTAHNLVELVMNLRDRVSNMEGVCDIVPRERSSRTHRDE